MSLKSQHVSDGVSTWETLDGHTYKHSPVCEIVFTHFNVWWRNMLLLTCEVYLSVRNNTGTI